MSIKHAMAITCVTLVAQSAFAQDTVRWQEVFGIVQPGAVVGVGTGAVTGGGLPWATTSGSASVNLGTGRIKFSVRGLVLGSGNAIGTRGGIAQVKGTLVCDTNGSAGGNAVLVDTPLVALSPEGDARFNDEVGGLPNACATESDIAFLVRTPGGAWIAYGAVRKP